MNKQANKDIEKIDFDAGNNKNSEYKVKAIWNSKVYTQKSEFRYL